MSYELQATSVFRSVDDSVISDEPVLLRLWKRLLIVWNEGATLDKSPQHFSE